MKFIEELSRLEVECKCFKTNSCCFSQMSCLVNVPSLLYFIDCNESVQKYYLYYFVASYNCSYGPNYYQNHKIIQQNHKRGLYILDEVVEIAYNEEHHVDKDGHLGHGVFKPRSKRRPTFCTSCWSSGLMEYIEI